MLPLIITGYAALAFLGVLLLWWLLSPTWEDTNRPSIENQLLTANTHFGHRRYPEAYESYKSLFTFVDGHEIASTGLRASLAEAKQNMERAYAQAKVIIDKREAEARQRAAELEAARLAEERRKAEQARAAELAARAAEQERQIAEQQRRAEDARVRAVAAEQRRQAAARAAIARSEEYRRLRSEADDAVRSLRLDLITEDSAYRGMSRRARATRDLLAILVKLEGKTAGVDVDLKVESAIRNAEISLIAEDSAIRAIYKCDQAILELTAIWAETQAKATPELPGKIQDIIRERARSIAFDDSAVRAINRYTEGVANAWTLIAAAKGIAPAAAARAGEKAKEDNNLETSAWRAAMRNSAANMELLLTMVSAKDPAEARKIRQSMGSENLIDDSALRVQGRYRQGCVDALHALITSLGQ